MSVARLDPASARTIPRGIPGGAPRGTDLDGLDPDLLRAFEIDKELTEFVYAATYLRAWLYAPTEGLRGLFEDAVS